MFFWTFYSSKNPEKISQVPKIIKKQKLFPTLTVNQQYYYDFWRSGDDEDWSNDAENTDAENFKVY